ncbi:MAG: phosphoribosylglycinamide formyltransferase [Spirochaetia bacterium]|jgi:formyltetrahydrofolate-dependent phosphoribosylglycinamide formyltransferase|nr:phosphoribosylglycinamide formyltransferase [Spirochaetia bacterium]
MKALSPNPGQIGAQSPKNLDSGARKARFVILVSGRGSNLQVFLDASLNGSLDARAVFVVSSESEAPALERARQAQVPARACPYRREPGLDRQASRRLYDSRLADLIEPWKPDYILLLGWMRILSNAFIGRFPGRIYNLHPALPGCFPGTQSIQRAWEAYQRGEITHSGAMIHLVPDEGVDTGPVLESEKIAFSPEQSLKEFEAEMHRLEHRLVLRAAARLAADFIKTVPNIKGG